MAIHQHQVSFSAFAFAFSVAAQLQQLAVLQVRTRSKTQTAVQSFQQPSLALRAGDGSSDRTPPVIAVHPAAPVVAHGVDGGECTGPRVNDWSAAHFVRRLSRNRALSSGRAVARWGVEICGVVVLYRSRARAFNNASRYSYARFVEVCV